MMTVEEWGHETDESEYKAVVNQEEQYSIWPVDKENPPGWRDTGQRGRKLECLTYIEKIWTDMRPLSLRSAMQPESDDV